MELVRPLMALVMEAPNCGVREEKGRGGGDGGMIRGALTSRSSGLVPFDGCSS